MVNPGAVYTISEDTAQWKLIHEQDPERRAMLEEHIKRYKHNPYWQNPRSTIGILEIAPNKQIKPRIYDLAFSAHA